MLPLMNAHVLVSTLIFQVASDSGYLIINAHHGRTESDIRNSAEPCRPALQEATWLRFFKEVGPKRNGNGSKVDLTREDVARAHGRHLTHVRGEIVPYVRLRERFQINGDAPFEEQIVIAECADCKVGFVVDKVIGEHQTVIKNLGRMYRDVEGISGATILGDGTVALIMDVHKLVRDTEMEDQKEPRIH